MSDSRQVLQEAEKALAPFAAMGARYIASPRNDYVITDVSIAALINARSVRALIRASLAEDDPVPEGVVDAFVRAATDLADNYQPTGVFVPEASVFQSEPTVNVDAKQQFPQQEGDVPPQECSGRR